VLGFRLGFVGDHHLLRNWLIPICRNGDIVLARGQKTPIVTTVDCKRSEKINFLNLDFQNFTATIQID